ncbi:MAG: histidinol-phosphatase [Saprospiraceae bacterium]
MVLKVNFKFILSSLNTSTFKLKKMRKLLFLDRDGTLVYEPHDYILDDFSKLEFYKGVIFNLKRIVDQSSFQLVMVTNQDGLGTDVFPEFKFQPIHDLILKIFKNEGIEFLDIHIDRSFPQDGLDTRKPGTGMLKAYFKNEFDLKNSVVIGDRLTDMELAKNLGAKGIWLDQEPSLGANEIHTSPLSLDETIVMKTQSWKEIADYLISL